MASFFYAFCLPLRLGASLHPSALTAFQRKGRLTADAKAQRKSPNQIYS